MLCAHMDTVPVADRIEVELEDGLVPQPPRRDPGRRRQGRASRCWSSWRAGSPSAVRRPAASWSSRPGRRSACAVRAPSTRRALGAPLRVRARPRRAARAHGRWPRRPTTQVHAEFLGRAAHAGIRPEEGRSAIAAAAARDRRDAARADRRRDHRQRRRDPGRHRRERGAGGLRDRGRGAQPRRRQGIARARARWSTRSRTRPARREVDVDTTVEEHFRAYRIPGRRSGRRAGRRRRCATAASSRCRRRPAAAATRARSTAKGFRCVNLAIGVELNHTPARAGQPAGAARRRSTWRTRIVERAAGVTARAEAAPRARRLGERGGRAGGAPDRDARRVRTRRAHAIAYPGAHRARCEAGDEVDRERRGTRPRPRQRGLRHRALQPHAWAGRRWRRRRARDEAQLHVAAARGRARWRRASSTRPSRAGLPVAVLALHGQLPCVAFALAHLRPGTARGLRADGRRRAAGRRCPTRSPTCSTAGCWPGT